MKISIIYSSKYGNTQKIAQSIQSGLGPESRLGQVEDFKIDDLKDLDLLIVGSPTQGGNPTPDITNWLKNLATNSLQNTKIASFDTRYLAKKQNAWLKFLMSLIQYAAPKMQKLMQTKGGTSIAEPEGFAVTAQEGPLAGGELERAKAWGQSLLTKIQIKL